MSNMKKGTKIFLAVLIVLVLLGLCFFCVAMYAKHEFEKEKSWLPPKYAPQQASVTELPDNVHDAYEYTMRLYQDALHHDAVEGSWYTEVDLGGDMTLPFAEADNKLIGMIRDRATPQVQALYPTVNGAKMTEEAADELPEIFLKESDILEYSYDPAAVFNRKGEYVSDTYEIVFKVDPAFENADEIRHGAVYEGICDILGDAMTVNDADLDVKNVEICFRIDRLTDRMISADVSRSYEIKADVTLTDDFAPLLGDGGQKDATVTLPYRATEKVSFKWYGLHFRDDYLEQRPDDIVTLPLDVFVNDAAVQGEDFTVTYTVSDPETMEIDDEGTMTVNRVSETSDTDGVTVTATLEYEGRTYEDSMIIYVTKLDKTTAGVRFWEDGFTVAAGQTAVMPAEIRVPVNEQADNKSEEEYELFLDISDPEALSVEIDGKELYATGLKAAQQPVTVTLSMKCGGHTYQAEIPVTITQGTEADNNG
ncbi:MAG: hypothetical protein IJK89_06830 [Clostridia bacterium]|nr:hypothetical protein [Clostridia bacterium]